MYISNFTGEIYDNLFHAISTIISDMVHFKSCRTLKAFSISRY